MSIEKCELCIANGGRFQAKNYCCQVRKLADAPKEHRTAKYQAVKREQGTTEVNRLIADVNEELGQRRARLSQLVQDAKNFINDFKSKSKR